MPSVERNLQQARNERKNENNPLQQYKKAAQPGIKSPAEHVSNSDIAVVSLPLKKSSISWKLSPKVEQSEECLESADADTTPVLTPGTLLNKAFNDLNMRASSKGYEADNEDESELGESLSESEYEVVVFEPFSTGGAAAPMGVDAGGEGGE